MLKSPERLYIGRHAAQRMAERRHLLVDAAIRVIAARGCTNLSVRNVCFEAGLSHRYFYESFKCKNELIIAAYGQLQRDLISHTIDAMGHLSEHHFIRLSRSWKAFLDFFQHNEHARWILFESNLPKIFHDDEGLVLLSDYQDLLADELMHSTGRFDSDERTSRATACGLLGATIQLTTRWLVCRPNEPIDETLAALHFIYAAVIKASVI